MSASGLRIYRLAQPAPLAAGQPGVLKHSAAEGPVHRFSVPDYQNQNSAEYQYSRASMSSSSPNASLVSLALTSKSTPPVNKKRGAAGSSSPGASPGVSAAVISSGVSSPGRSSISTTDGHHGSIRICVFSEDESRYRLSLNPQDSMVTIRQYLERKAKLSSAKILLYFPDKLGDCLKDSTTIEDLQSRPDKNGQGTSQAPLTIYLVKNRAYKQTAPLTRIRLVEFKKPGAAGPRTIGASTSPAKAKESNKEPKENGKESASQSAVAAAAAIGLPTPGAPPTPKPSSSSRGSTVSKSLNPGAPNIVFLFLPASDTLETLKTKLCERLWSLEPNKDWRMDGIKIRKRKKAEKTETAENQSSTAAAAPTGISVDPTAGEEKPAGEEEKKADANGEEIASIPGTKENSQEKSFDEEEEDEEKRQAGGAGDGEKENSDNGKSAGGDGETALSDVEIGLIDSSPAQGETENNQQNPSSEVSNAVEPGESSGEWFPDSLYSQSLTQLGFHEDFILEFAFSLPINTEIGKRFDLIIEDVRKRLYKIPVHDLMPIGLIKHKFFVSNRGRKHWTGVEISMIHFKIGGTKLITPQQEKTMTLRDFNIGASKLPAFLMEIMDNSSGGKCCDIM